MSYQIKTKSGLTVLHDGKPVYGSDRANVVKAVDDTNRQISIVGTDETKDRQGDIVSMTGWDLKNFLKNPVFLWAHNYSSVPIAAATNVIKRRAPSRLVFTEKFPPEKLFPFADLIYELYKIKQINASSVGFIPSDWEEMKEGEPSVFGWPKRYLKQELLELSGCPVPANPSALQEGLKALTGKVDVEKLWKQLEAGEIEPPKDIDEVMGGLQIHQIDYDEEGTKIFKSATVEDEVFNTIVASKSTDDEEPPEEPEVEDGEDQDEFDDEDEKEEALVWMDIEDDVVLEPYPNEHACRLAQPVADAPTRRQNGAREHDGKKYDVIFQKQEDKWVEQAYRYPKDSWETAAARSHCNSHKGLSFEAAKEVTEMEEKGIGISKSLPLADKTIVWDSEKAVENMKKFSSEDGSGNAEKMDWAKYRKGFCWYNAEDMEKFESYKFPIADVFEGTLRAVYNGVVEVMGILNGARGGAGITDVERKSIYNLIAHYYRRFDEQVPELRSFTDLAEEFNDTKRTVEERLNVLSQRVQSRTAEIEALIQRLALLSRSKGNETSGGPNIFDAILAVKPKEASAVQPTDESMKLITGVQELAKSIKQMLKN